VASLAALAGVWRGLDRSPPAFREFLSAEVGIRHRGHVTSCVAWMRENADRGGGDGDGDVSTSGRMDRGPAGAGASMRVTLSVEGNIGAGKTTFLDMLDATDGGLLLSDGGGRGGGGRRQNRPPLNARHLAAGSSLLSGAPVSGGGWAGGFDDNHLPPRGYYGHARRCVREPVDEWTRVPYVDPASGLDRPVNALDSFYKDAQRYAYLFQNHVFMTRWDASRSTDHFSEPVRVTERSVWSDRMVFVRQLEEDCLLNDVELAVYDDTFGRVVSGSVQTLVPDGFVYLRVTPDVAQRRVRGRGRSEEKGLPEAYLEGLHNKHEEWFLRNVSYGDVKRAMAAGGGGGHSSRDPSSPLSAASLGAVADEHLAWGSGEWEGAPRMSGDASRALLLPRRRGILDASGGTGSGSGGALASRATGAPWAAANVAPQHHPPLPAPPAAIADDVYLLRGNGVGGDVAGDGMARGRTAAGRRWGALLEGVPYLNVDYSSDLDTRDPAVRAELGAKVDAFADWVDEVRVAREGRGTGAAARAAAALGRVEL